MRLILVAFIIVLTAVSNSYADTHLRWVNGLGWTDKSASEINASKKNKSNSNAMTTFLVNSAAGVKYTACPAGYKEKKVYKITEMLMRFKGEGEFKRCLNQTQPELNNAKDSWGIGYANFRCGNIQVLGNLNTMGDLQVRSSAGWLQFIKYGQNKSIPNRKFCKKIKMHKEDSCFQENGFVGLLYNPSVTKEIEYQRINRTVYERCTEITF